MPTVEKPGDDAAILALSMLKFLASEPERFSRFLDVTGMREADIAAVAGEASFHGAIVDYLLQDESLLMIFCQENDINPQRPARARRHLPGFSPEY